MWLFCIFLSWSACVKLFCLFVIALLLIVVILCLLSNFLSLCDSFASIFSFMSLCSHCLSSCDCSVSLFNHFASLCGCFASFLFVLCVFVIIFCLFVVALCLCSSLLHFAGELAGCWLKNCRWTLIFSPHFRWREAVWHQSKLSTTETLTLLCRGLNTAANYT